ncbi:MAG: polysaccharide biosynthesis/export family protein [Myxococcota bacterium]|nr:polysaccharide biosynthesis/export family protein [Myxococcota bacterium]
MKNYQYGKLMQVGLLLALGCGSAAQVRDLPPMPDTATIMQSATLGPGDVVEVRVYQEKELSGLFRVGVDGLFSYPLVGEVSAKGLTASQLASTITTSLKAGYLREPQVSVFVKEFNSKKVFVLGEVRKPGTFRYEDKMTIVQAVTLAGGLKALAAKDRLILTRLVEGDEKKFVVPFERISQGRVSNIFLQPGDIVFVPESWL